MTSKYTISLRYPGFILISFCFPCAYSACAGPEYKSDDRHCWTGEKIGEYTQKVMSTGVDAQRYNPEVPSNDASAYSRSTKSSELVDKLIKLRHTIANAVSSITTTTTKGCKAINISTNFRWLFQLQDSQYLPVISHSDVQGDMARHDEEGSGNFRDENDDEEYGNGSGDGSGEGKTTAIIISIVETLLTHNKYVFSFQVQLIIRRNRTLWIMWL